MNGTAADQYAMVGLWSGLCGSDCPPQGWAGRVGSFIFKAELDEDLTRACTVLGDSDSDSDDEEVTDAEEPQSKSVASQVCSSGLCLAQKLPV